MPSKESYVTATHLLNSKISEIEKISKLMSIFKRSPMQRNQIYETDSEILDLGLENNIVLTSDALCEEIEWKLICDPYIIGWINLVSSLSDLAAVAADPIGVLIGLSHSEQHEENFLKRFWQGTHDALKAHSTFLLGGDTNISSSFLVSCTGLGQRSKSISLSRKGLVDDDIVYITGPVGMGVATGFANLVIKKQSPALAGQIEQSFKPKARFSESKVISHFASSCIDTSDGLLAALDFLCELNNTCCSLRLSKSHFHSTALQLAKQLNVPLILFSSIHLGEFELLYTVPKKDKQNFELEMLKQNLIFLEIGQINSNLHQLEINDCAIDLVPVRNLLNDMKDPAIYLNAQQVWADPLHGLIPT